MREKPAQSTSVLDELVFVGRSGPAEWTGEQSFGRLATPLVEPLSSSLEIGDPDSTESAESDLTIRQRMARFMTRHNRHPLITVDFNPSPGRRREHCGRVGGSATSATSR